MRWDLSSIYKSAGCPGYASDIERIHTLLSEIAALVNKHVEAPPLLEAFDLVSEAYELFEKLENYLELSLMIDATNSEAKNARGALYDIENEIHTTKLGLASLISANPDQLQTDKLEESYAGFLLEMKRLSRNPTSMHEAVSILRITGSEAWRSFRSERLAQAQKTLELNLGNMQNGIRNGSQAQAEECLLSEIKLSKAAAEDALVAIYNIKLEFHNRSKLYGFNSALDLMLDTYLLDRELFQTFINAAGQLGQKLLEQYLSFSNCVTIKPYEFDRINNHTGDVSYEECVRIVRDCFISRSELLAEMLDEAKCEGLIDNEPRGGKRSGACITPIHAMKRSFILSNDTGSIRAIISLAHELGHSYHQSMMFRYPIVETRSPMIINEFVSKFFELWIMDYMEELGILSRSGVRELMLKTLLRTFCQTMALFDFEQQFFGILEKGFPSVADTSQIMTNSLKRMYGDRLDENLVNPYEWVIKPHLYYTDISYYNFPYAIGNILALVLYPRFKSGLLSIDELGAALSQSGRLRSFQEFLDNLNVSSADILAVSDAAMSF